MKYAVYEPWGSDHLPNTVVSVHKTFALAVKANQRTYHFPTLIGTVSDFTKKGDSILDVSSEEFLFTVEFPK